MRSTLLFFLLVPVIACSDKGASDDSGGDTDGGADTGGADGGGTDTGDALEFTPGITWFNGLAAVDVTPDGRTALAQDITSLEGDLVLIDAESGGRTVATTLGDATRDLATGLSSDLRISAYRGETTQAQVWSEGQDWTALATPYASGCDYNEGGAFDISDDGLVVVGLMWDGCTPAAFRWTEAGGTVPLDVLGESGSTQSNRASVVSGDGQVAAGFAASGNLDRSPARWLADGSGTLLDPDNIDAPGEVLSIDWTGQTLAGISGTSGFVWTEAAGMVDLGLPPEALGGDPVYPLAMSADGAQVLGGVGSEFFSVPIAFVWDADQGMRALQALVEAAGIEIEEGWVLTSVVAVSDDLQVIVGRGFDPDYATQLFVLRIDPVAAGLR